MGIINAVVTGHASLVRALLSDAIHKIGGTFAIHGFCSDGRHDVEYYRSKDFDQPYNDAPKARLAGMTGQLSTRMGAAIRHSTHYLRAQKSSKKLLMVITEGESADIDVRDPQYLRYDTKKAVEEAARHYHFLHDAGSARRSICIPDFRGQELHGGRSDRTFA